MVTAAPCAPVVLGSRTPAPEFPFQVLRHPPRGSFPSPRIVPLSPVSFPGSGFHSIYSSSIFTLSTFSHCLKAPCSSFVGESHEEIENGTASVRAPLLHSRLRCARCQSQSAAVTIPEAQSSKHKGVREW